MLKKAGIKTGDVIIAIDGKEVKFVETSTTLTIENVPAEFELTIKTQISPKNNSALMGLYVSDGKYCTQCEPEGFRRITFFLDHPDVLAKYISGNDYDRFVEMMNGKAKELGMENTIFYNASGLKENEKCAELKAFEARNVCITSPEQSLELKAKHESLKKEINNLHDWGLRVFKVESELKFLQDKMLK